MNNTLQVNIYFFLPLYKSNGFQEKRKHDLFWLSLYPCATLKEIIKDKTTTKKFV